MPRDIPIGNGSLLINFDQNYNIRNIYYPNVDGIEHTLGHISSSGVWVEGHFSWLSSHEWKKSLQYQDDSLVTQVIAVNQQLGISLIINDTVDYQENIFLRRFAFKNLSSYPRQIRLFINHDLHLSESKVGDTAYYDPKIKSIIHYKRSQYFLINCLCSGHYGVEEYAVGVQDFGQALVWGCQI
jgi:glucoamylase